MSTLRKAIAAGLASVLLAGGIGVLTPQIAQADELTSLKGYSAYDSSSKKIVDRKTTFTYNKGNPITPVNFLMNSMGKRIDRSDVVCYYLNNRNPGTATVIIKGINDKGFTDSIRVSYKIAKDGSSGGTSTGDLRISSIPDQTWTGSAIKPTLTVKSGGSVLTTSQYSVSYKNNTNVGTATITVTGRGTYRGKKATINFNIRPANISSAQIADIPRQKYTGRAITPAVSVSLGGKKLSSGTHYTVSYSNNQNPGTATVTVTGKGNVTGTRKLTFGISKPIGGLTIDAVKPQKYTGNPITPKPAVKIGGKALTAGKDFNYSYENNISPGTARGYINFIGDYAPNTSQSFNFSIVV